MAKDIDTLSEDQLEQYEGNIVDALLESAGYVQDKDLRRKITIKRGGKIMFSFTIQPLSDADWETCRRQNTKNRGKRDERIDNIRWSAQVIYLATIDEDRQRLWDNKEIWAKLNVARGVDVIAAVIMPGEKAKIVEEIQNISGYGDDYDVDELIKNA